MKLAKLFALCDVRIFDQQLETARSLLIIGDNAGETVFDRVLIEKLSYLSITYAVRSAPIINDATIDDVHSSGLDQSVHIISTGCDVPGVILGECSKSFLDIFYNANIAISKGQGNYETLSDCDRPICFLLKAKCPVLSKLLGVDLQDYVFKYSDTSFTKNRLAKFENT